jgi:TfoX/Sxy family transcriptional regulator of competence genes
MPHDPHLADLMRQAVKDRAGITEKKMFGGFCWMLNGNMLCGVEVGRFMFRVGKELEPEALEKPGTSPMDITGRPMGGIIWVDADTAIDDGLETWLDFAGQFVGALKPK